MSRSNHDDYDQAAAADRLVFRYGESLTCGASALHGMDPFEIACRIEEQKNPEERAAADRWALRHEIFSGFVEYVFADGPAPKDVRERLEGFFRSFYPELADRIRGEHEWVAPEKVATVLRKHYKKLAAVAAAQRSRGSLSHWNAELELEIDFEGVREMLVELVKLVASQGSDWRRVTAATYCIAKALRPALIAGMSLEDIAILSGDKGGRATPQNRTKRIYNDRVEAAGFKAIHVHFQKSAAVIEKYREAQKGNTNRRDAKRKPKKKNHDPR